MAGPAELLEDLKRLLGDLPERLADVLRRTDSPLAGVSGESRGGRRGRGGASGGAAGVGGQGPGGPEPLLGEQGEDVAGMMRSVIAPGAALGLPGFGGALKGLNTLFRLQEMMKALAAMREGMKPPFVGPPLPTDRDPWVSPESPLGEGPIPLQEPPKTVPLAQGPSQEEHWGERVPVEPSADGPLTARPILPGQRRRGRGDAETIPVMPEGREAARPWEDRAGADPSSRLGETIPLQPESARPIVERPVPPSPVPLADELPPIPLVGATPPPPAPPSRRLGETVGARPPGQAPLPGTQPFPVPPPAPPANFGPSIPFASEGPEPPPGTPPGPTPPPETIPAEPAGPRSAAHLEPTGMDRWGGSTRRLFLEDEAASRTGPVPTAGGGDAAPSEGMGQLGERIEKNTAAVEKLAAALERKAAAGSGANRGGSTRTPRPSQSTSEFMESSKELDVPSPALRGAPEGAEVVEAAAPAADAAAAAAIPPIVPI